MSITTALGAAGWLGIKVTPPTAASPTMIMTLAVANCVHLLVTFLQRMRAGDKRPDAMRESLQEVGFGVFADCPAGISGPGITAAK